GICVTPRAGRRAMEQTQRGIAFTVDSNPFGASPGCFARFDPRTDYARMARLGLRHVEVLAVGAAHFSSLAPEAMDDAAVEDLLSGLRAAGLPPMSVSVAPPLHDPAGLAWLKRRLDLG